MTLTTPAKKDCLRESGAFAWVVVIALGLMSAGTTGTYSIIAGSFVAPVCEDLGFDYTSFSFYFTAILLGLALGLPLLSRFIPKVIGKPWHICIELVLIVAGAAMAFYTEVWMFTVSAAVIGICFSFTTGVCMSDVIDQWFSKSSGLAIGLAWGVNSLCTLLLSPVITLVIEQQGWRTGYIVLAAVSAAMIWKDLFDRLLSGLCRRCFWNAGHDEGLRHGGVIPGSIYLLHCLQPYDCCVCYRFRLSQ